MCGIAGLAGGPPDPEVLARMAAVLRHRGPDAEGRLEDETAGFAFRRLSIIDVAGGDQPIYNEAGTAAIILNGEIYNHRELRRELEAAGHRFRTRSDAEAVLHLWEDEGEACLSRLLGMFAFAIWDGPRRSLLLARDRLGKKPLYVSRLAGGGLVFGSEIKAILQHPEVARSPDPAALDLFLTLQYVPAPRTAFAGIERMPPASWLRWRDGAVEEGVYWRPDFGTKSDLPAAELPARLLELLRDAVRARLESEVPLGALLSGGIDSSAVVALAAEAPGGPLRTFSVGFADPAFDESPFARLVAERFGTDHHELVLEGASPDLLEHIVWHYDQPFGDSSALPSFEIARLTRRHVTVALNGDGGDESFGGYPRYALARRLSRLAGAPSPARDAAYRLAAMFSGRGGRVASIRPRDAAGAYFATLVHLVPADKARLYTPEFGAALAASAPAPPLAFMRSRASVPMVDAMLETDIHNYLPDDLLVKMDVATMAHSLEARSPLLDHRLVEFMAAVPPHLKVGRGGGKLLLKRALRGVLPDQVLDRPKMGFGVPLAAWLRTGFREVLGDLVASDRAAARGLLRRAEVERLISVLLGGDDTPRYILWDLLMLELWHRTFIDRAPQAPTTSLSTALTR
jgi:asparagine synthase (glutamine-hydrolysing)